MPIFRRLYCPQCGEWLRRRPAGRCPECGADVRQHVQEEREKETRVDQVIAVVSTILVIGLFFLIGGLKVFEGIAAYALAGAVIWWLAKRTFW